MDETLEYRLVRVLNRLEVLVGRLEAVCEGIGPRESGAAQDGEQPPLDTWTPEDQKALETKLSEYQETREAEAESLAARVNSGEVTESEVEEHMNRWRQTTRPVLR